MTSVKSMSPRLTRGWQALILVSLVAGALLRLLHVQDMEYKEDEEYNFTQTQLQGALGARGGPWPWFGMPSGVYIPNPGMSVWVFTALARISGATTPTELCTALQVFAWIGIALLIPFALKVLREHEDREPWLWALCLALVNPFAVFYQRKLWPEPFLPFFSTIMLAGWWKRDRAVGAFAWGAVGACLGQIHMSGFFFAFGFLLVTLLLPSSEIPRSKVHWRAWFVGSCIGALPLIPWVIHILQHPNHETIAHGWGEIIQGRFWVFWATNPTGLHLGNPLGLLRGQSNFAQISDFVRYPIIRGHATYLNAAAHALALMTCLWIFWRGASRCASEFRSGRLQGLRHWLLKPRSDLALAIIAGLWGFGVPLTASSVNIRRYYLMVSFPLEFLWLARLALGEFTAVSSRLLARQALATLWASQLFMSACFVNYVHVNEGATSGDYGEAYHVIMKRREEQKAKQGH